MNFLDTNPFRVLGVNVTSSEKEIVKSVSTLTTYLEMGKEKKLSTDLPFLSPLNRTSESVTEARKLIEQPANKFQQSLFWYWINNTTDEIVMELLVENNIDKSVALFEKSIFHKKDKTFKLSVITENFINDKTNWGGTADDENHSYKKLGSEFLIERKIDKSDYSIVTDVHDINLQDDWSIECDSRWLSGKSNCPYGMVIGSNGKGSYCTFGITADGSYNFLKYNEWTDIDRIIDWTESSHIRENGLNNLRVSKNGNTFELFINDNKVNTVDSFDIIGNRFGFRVYQNQKISYTNFKISKLIEDDNYISGIRVTNKNVSNLKNLSTLFLQKAFESNQINKLYFTKAIALFKCFQESEFVESYSKLVSGDKFKINNSEILLFYVNTLIEATKTYFNKDSGITEVEFTLSFSEFPIEIKNVLINKFISKNIQNIDEEIELSKKSRKVDQSNAIKYGKQLKNKTILDLVYIKKIVGKEDLKYMTLADKIATEIVQCGIDSFNSYKTPTGEIDYVLAIQSEESYLQEYEYANAIAESISVKEKAFENLESCKRVIDDKDSVICWFCKTNTPNESSAVGITIYKVTDRTYFPRSVNYKYLDLKVPRCSKCESYHFKQANKSNFAMVVIIILGIIIGSLAFDSDGGWAAGGFFGAIIGYLVRELYDFNKPNGDIKNHIQNKNEAFRSKEVKKYINLGWSTNKPTA